MDNIIAWNNKNYRYVGDVSTFNKVWPQSNLIQLKLEKQTPASHLYAKLVACLSVEPSHERGIVRLVQAASSNNTAESK